MLATSVKTSGTASSTRGRVAASKVGGEGLARHLAGLALVQEEPAFPRHPPGVAGQLAVGADHAVAGDHDPDRVGAVGGADRTRRRGRADRAREVPVRDRPAGRDAPQGLPHAALERRAAGVDGDGGESIERTGKVGREAADDPARVARRTKLHPAESPAQLLPATRPAGPELEGAEPAVAYSEHDLPDRRCDLGDVERGHDRSSLSPGTAAEAGTETLGLRRGCVREPAYVLRLGPGRAGRQAVDPGGHDTVDRALV